MKKLLRFFLFFLLLMFPLITIAQDVQVNLNSYMFSSENIVYEEFTDGTPTGINGDDVAANFNLPFTFIYAGVEFTQVRICTNGWVSVGTNTLISWTNDLASTTNLKFLAALWDDLYAPADTTEITYRTEGEAPYRVFAIQYKTAQRLGSTTDDLNFQIRIYETKNEISFTYGIMASTYTNWSASLGINGSTGGSNDFISVTPTDPPVVSSTVANNAINLAGVTSLSNKKYSFVPTEFVTLLEPLNYANNISVTPLFTWEALEGYVSYTIQVSTLQDFSDLTISESSIENTFYQVPVGSELDESTVYYWRVKAIDLDGNESSWSGRIFVTEGEIPAIILVSPENAAVDISPLATFTWLQNLAASNYEIEVASDFDFINVVATATGLTETNWSLTETNALENNTTYYWRVRGYTGDNIGEWSEVWSFTTLTMVNTSSYIVLEQDNTFYEEFTDGLPSVSGDDESANYDLPFTFVYAGVEFNQVRICTNGWLGLGGDITHNSYTNDLASNEYYRLLAACWDDLSVIPGSGEITYRTEGVSPNQAFAVQYRNVCRISSSGESLNFQIRIYESNGEISFTYGTMNASNDNWTASVGTIGLLGGSLDFISATPGNPSSFSSIIANNNIDQSGVDLLTNKKFTFLPMGDYVMLISPLNNSITETEVTLDWEDFAGASTYQLQVSTSSDFSTTIVDESDLVNSTYDLSELAPLTRYFWRVRAFAAEYTYWTSVWTFITSGELPAPTLIAPENGIIDVTPALILIWDINSFATGYTLQVSTTPDFTEMFLEETGLTNNSYNISGLSVNTLYYWRVQMYNPFNTSQWCEAWTFTTGSNIGVTIGNGVDYNNSTDYPAPYGNWYWGAKHQILVLAEEIIASGGVAGYLTSLSFNIQELYTADALTNFEIKLKQTTDSDLDENWDIDGFNSVYLNPSLINTLGWNTHIFSTPFPWDGVSNILVDVCFNNSSYTLNQSTYYSSTEFNSVRCFFSDNNTSVCSNPTFAVISVNRPNILFGMDTVSIIPPTLDLPTNDENFVSLTPLFEWSDVEKATSYTLQVSTNQLFSELIINENGILESNYLAAELSYNTQYFWRVNATDGTQTSEWSDVWSFTTMYEIINPPLSWEYTLFTGNDATVIIPFYINPVLINRPFSQGDAIGVFYTNDYNQLACAGYVIWDNSNLGLVVSGDNETTPIKEGFALGEVYSFKVWDCQSGIEYLAIATFSEGANVYQVNGFSIMSSLTVLSPVEIPTLISPINNATEVPVNCIFEWNSAIGANEYIIQISTNSDFSDNILESELTGTSFEFNSLAYSTQYFWRVKATDGIQTSEWSEIWNFTTMYEIINPPTSWEYTPFTGNDATVIIPFYINPILINRPFSQGDAIGVFYTNDYNQLACAGYVIWDNSNLGLVVNGDNETTPIKDGFDVGEAYTFKVWDSQSGIDYFAIATFFEGANVYQVNGFSIMSSLTVLSPLEIPTLISPVNNATEVSINFLFEWNPVTGANEYNIQISTTSDFSDIIFESEATETSIEVNNLAVNTQYFWRVNATNVIQTSEWSEVWSFTTEFSSLQIILNNGWNAVSSYFTPTDADLYNIFDDISSKVNVIKNGSGQICVPMWDINQIGNWNVLDGYQIYTNDGCSFLIIGEEIIPENSPIELSVGWHFVSYLRNNPMSVITALQSIEGNFIFVKNGKGNVYHPFYGINTIGNMQPLQGYWLYITSPTILTYPANSAQKALAGDNLTPQPKQLIPQFYNTGNSANLILELNGIDNGNEIGVYNLNNQLIGSGVVHNGNAAITIWGDDEITTELDGAIYNELLTVKLLKNNSLHNILLFNINEITTNTEQSNLLYKANAIYTAKAGLYESNNLSFSISSIPNPTSSNTTFEFSLSNESEAVIEIYTLTGELIANIPNSKYTAGMHKVSFDASNLASGVYNVVLRSGNQRAMTLMIIEK